MKQMAMRKPRLQIATFPFSGDAIAGLWQAKELSGKIANLSCLDDFPLTTCLEALNSQVRLPLEMIPTGLRDPM